jgi:hypothetical protein
MLERMFGSCKALWRCAGLLGAWAVHVEGDARSIPVPRGNEPRAARRPRVEQMLRMAAASKVSLLHSLYDGGARRPPAPRPSITIAASCSCRAASFLGQVPAAQRKPLANHAPCSSPSFRCRHVRTPSNAQHHQNLGYRGKAWCIKSSDRDESSVGYIIGQSPKKF